MVIRATVSEVPYALFDNSASSAFPWLCPVFSLQILYKILYFLTCLLGKRQSLCKFLWSQILSSLFSDSLVRSLQKLSLKDELQVWVRCGLLDWCSRKCQSSHLLSPWPAAPTIEGTASFMLQGSNYVYQVWDGSPLPVWFFSGY